MHLRMCARVVRGCSLCGRLLVRTHARRFGMEVLLDMWQLELEIVWGSYKDAELRGRAS